MKPKRCMMIGLATLASFLGQSIPANAMLNSPVNDKDRLSMALEYFQSEKYREALLLFRKLDQEYLLNQRYKAYIGVCCYRLWKYEEACMYLDPVMPSVTVYAPHEQSVYYYANAESHFQLKQYQAAIPCYEKMLNVCHDNEKADALYRLGFCYLFRKDWENALEYFESARAYYQRYGYKAGLRQRLEQVGNMINGCKRQTDPTASAASPSDSAK